MSPIRSDLFLFSGGLFFAKKMREEKYVTMMDPFQFKYGNVISAVLSVALLVSDIIWVTGTLIGLGKNSTFSFEHITVVCVKLLCHGVCFA